MNQTAVQLSKIVPTNNCKECDRPACSGELNTLRVYTDWSDLVDHVDEQTVVEWVNRLHKITEQRKLCSKRANARNKLLLEQAEELGL